MPGVSANQDHLTLPKAGLVVNEPSGKTRRPLATLSPTTMPRTQPPRRYQQEANTLPVLKNLSPLPPNEQGGGPDSPPLDRHEAVGPPSTRVADPYFALPVESRSLGRQQRLSPRAAQALMEGIEKELKDVIAEQKVVDAWERGLEELTLDNLRANPEISLPKTEHLRKAVIDARLREFDDLIRQIKDKNLRDTPDRKALLADIEGARRLFAPDAELRGEREDDGGEGFHTASTRGSNLEPVDDEDDRRLEDRRYLSSSPITEEERESGDRRPA